MFKIGGMVDHVTGVQGQKSSKSKHVITIIYLFNDGRIKL